MTDVQSHQVILQVMLSSSEIDAAADMVFKIRASCPEGCNLIGQLVEIVTHDSAVVEAVLTEFDGTSSQAGEVIAKSPIEPGEYSWTAVFPTQEKDGIVHQADTLPFTFTVRPHTIIVTVSEVPAIIVMDNPFEIRVEAQCTFGCELVNRPVEVFDQTGTLVAAAVLHDTAKADGMDIACTRVDLVAPDIEKRFRWTVRVPATDQDLLHGEGIGSFAISTTRRPDHMVSVQVTDRDSGEPVENASVIFRPQRYKGATYRGQTDATGVINFDVPTGKYQLYASAGRKDFLEPVISIADDMTIPVEIWKRERQWWEP